MVGGYVGTWLRRFPYNVDDYVKSIKLFGGTLIFRNHYIKTMAIITTSSHLEVSWPNNEKIELNMKSIMRNGSCLPKGAEYILNLYTYEMLDTRVLVPIRKSSFYPMG
uniref:Uncharacterized protein n=1 Tax=Glossina pallidipes TaxID=7398 RepID=A0A1B0A5Z6_GLOPL